MTDPTPHPFWAVIAHAGAPLHYPENSLAGFKAALNQAMLHPSVNLFLEADVQASRDGVALAHHDVRLSRMVGLSGSAGDHDFASIAAQRLKPGKSNTRGPIDFSRAPEDVPLHRISDADYRTPSMRELLELIHQTNQYRAQHGTPVGLCLDLKSAKSFTALENALEDFTRTHPDAHLPTVTLGLSYFVSPQQMQQLKDSLDEKVLRHFHPDSVVPMHAVRLVSLLENGYRALLATASYAQGANQFSRWTIAGDLDPHPDRVYPPEGQSLRGGYPALVTRPAMRKAMQRQDVLWVDDPFIALDEVDRVQRDPAALNVQPTHVETLAMGHAEAAGRRK